MELFGGKIVPYKAVAERIATDIVSVGGLNDVPLILTIPSFQTSNRAALVFDAGATISGDFSCAPEEKWIKKNQICMIACFGDLVIEGDLLDNSDKFWPVLYVGGNLSVCNILKGGMPLVVRDNLNARGYVIGEFNDGPMRVGGDLNALGYIPCAKDRKELRGHVVVGTLNARVFDARTDFTDKDIRRAAVEEVLNHKWFNVHKVLEKGRAGQSIWKRASTGSDAEKESSPQPKPPVPVLKAIDPLPLGTLHAASEMQPQMESVVRERISEYPESFAEFIRYQLAEHPQGQVLVLPPNTRIDGDLQLDWRAAWCAGSNVRAIICMGDLMVTGTIRNTTLEGGPMLFVGGQLRIDNLLKSGAPVIVLGDVVADGLVIGEYNDGVMRIGGDLTAQFYILLDHDGDVRGTMKAHVLNEDGGDLREMLIDDVFASDEEYSPDVELIWAHYSAGKPILRQ